MRNGRELFDLGIITSVNNPDKNVQQHGIDLNVVKISKVNSGGFIPIDGKTQIPKYSEVDLMYTESNMAFWALGPGSYYVEMHQGCDVPKDMMLLIRSRSSLSRIGASINSPIFDAGFKTDNIGTIMTVTETIRIEHSARICQIYGHLCSVVGNLYDGQFQNDKQREDDKQ